MKKQYFLTKLLFILLYFLMVSCQTSDNETNLIKISKFNSESNITLKDHISIDTNYSADRLYLLDTSIIVANILKAKNKYLFYEYSNSSKKEIGKFIKWGTDEKMAYSAMSIGVLQDKIFWVHDFTLNKIMTVPLNYKYVVDSIKVYPLKDFVYSTQYMKNNALLEAGFFSAPEYLIKLDLNSGQILKKIGEFIPPNSSYDLYTWKAALEGFLFLKPDENYSAIASRYSDRLNIINLTNGEYKLIQGPENIMPRFKSILEPEMKNYSIARTKETVFSFLGGKATDQYIYLMYSGKTELESNYHTSRIIYVYDWSGNPIKKINLDQPVIDIAISKDDKKIYAINANNNKILVSNLINN